MSFRNMILMLAAIGTALMAGLFFAYSCSVNPGLSALEDAEYLSAMQSINRAIQNPVFFSCFFGTLLLLPFSAILFYRASPPGIFHLLLAASIVYAAGVISVTAFGNVPLNNGLDIFVIKGTTPEAIAKQRAVFEVPWNRLNTIRTVASLLSVILVMFGLRRLKE